MHEAACQVVRLSVSEHVGNQFNVRLRALHLNARDACMPWWKRTHLVHHHLIFREGPLQVPGQRLHQRGGACTNQRRMVVNRPFLQMRESRRGLSNLRASYAGMGRVCSGWIAP